MTEQISSNKRIAKNTIMLYIRMLLSMVVSLYTSRVVLNTLGVEDYGIYGVVGGVVAMFSFLNASMSGATSRFLTYEMGRGNQQCLKETFTSALIVHIFVALVVFVLSETVGVWFLVNKLVIPDERMFAAHIVYQFSILSTIVGITQVPYNAVIIAHEKMDIYAYVELLNVVLKLLIVFLLPVLGNDKLIVYSCLVLFVSVLIACIYRVYCIKKYSETKFCFVFKKDIVYPMLSFSGWDLYGNLSGVARQQGVNILINMFFGAVQNAASSIATSVQGIVSSFAVNIVMAARPQIVKSYAVGDVDRMLDLIRQTIRVNYFLLLLLSVPLIVELDFIFEIWLNVVPENATIFCIYTLIFNFVSNISLVVAAGLHALKRIKVMSIVNGTLYLLVVPLSYVFFLLGFKSFIPYLFNILLGFLGLLSNAYLFSKYVSQFSFINFILKDIVPIILILLFLLIGMHYFSEIFPVGWFRLILVAILSTSIVLLLGYIYILPKDILNMIINYIRKKISAS